MSMANMSNDRGQLKRVPLADAGHRVNKMAPSNQLMRGSSSKPSPLSVVVPRNESLLGDGSLDVRHSLPSPKHKRVSEVNEEEGGSKRDSALSTSTNGSGGARKRKTHIGPWQLGQTIGKGGTSRVRKVRHTITGESAVAKIIAKAVAEKQRTLSLANLTKKAESNDPGLMGAKVIPFGLEREIVIMKLLNHRNIVRLFDVWENRNELYLVMEYVEGCELFEYVAQRQFVEERDAIFMFRQIVAALLYCHRLRIHHRDLKPENILLNPETMQIKVVDFGYAALQPNGGLLTTPCGSPHYAAPEVIQGRAYDGSKSDMWSCGVILFVLLCGIPPFNFPPDPNGKISEEKKLRGLFNSILNASYKMPSGLSAEAQDLIRMIFIVNPSKRISIEQLWNHPLLHKYDEDFGLDATATTIEAWIGPYPKIDNWEPVTRRTIDREILRNLRTLWHSVDEEFLIANICNDKPNQEKYFYKALLKYREESVDNAPTSGNAVVYSNSDHQHAKPAQPHDRLSSRISQSSGKYRRSHSKYSVVGDEHLYSRHSFFDQPTSEASYDPFRATSVPIYNPGRSSADKSIRRRESTPGTSLRVPNANGSHKLSLQRVDALRKGSRRSSGFSSANSSLRGSLRSSGSRSSVPSGQWSSAHFAAMRPSSVHKRGVSFSHSKRLSNHHGIQYDAAVLLDHAEILRPGPASGEPAAASHRSKQDKSSITVTKSRGIKGLLAEPTPRTRKIRDIEQEARKVSVELKQIMDEAFFNRDSISSSIRTSITDRPNPYIDTPPSSVSSAPKDGARIKNRLGSITRPLPPTPINSNPISSAETAQSFTTRELAQLRSKLAQKYAEDGTEEYEEFTDVLKQLDNLMASESKFLIDSNKRVVSAPHANSPRVVSDTHSPLHVIPEEGRMADTEEFPARAGAYRLQSAKLETTFKRTQPRAVTDPVAGKHGEIQKPFDNSIRLVVPSSPPSPSPWAPLNIRKRSKASSPVASNKSPINPGKQGNAFDRSVSLPAKPNHRDNIESPVKYHPFADLDDRVDRRDREYLNSPEKYVTSVSAREKAQGLGTYRLGAVDTGDPAAASTDVGSSRFAGLRKLWKRSKLSNVVTGNVDVNQPNKGNISETTTIKRDTQAEGSLHSGRSQEGFKQIEARPLLARLFRFKPKQLYLAINTRNDIAAPKVHDYISRHGGASAKIEIRWEPDSTTHELQVKAEKPGLPFVHLAIEFFSIVPDAQPSMVRRRACVTVLRFTQLAGSARSMAFIRKQIIKAVCLNHEEWVMHDRKQQKACIAAIKKGPTLHDGEKTLRRKKGKFGLRGTF